MDTPGSLPYLPGRPADRTRPLERFIPPIPEGVVTRWLAAHAPPGAWVLDPFGVAPELPVEAARAGYRVLVAANNPVTRFLLEMYADPPAEGELRGALADLAAARKGDQRLEPLMQSLYATSCANCGREVIADAFVWSREEPLLEARLYRCPHCGDEGERPATESDLEHAARFAARGLHMAWALERVAPVNDPDRQHAVEALEVYLPRAVYAIFTLINKLDGTPITPDRRRLLTALLISAFDRGNNLWVHPGGRTRPRQLSTPPRHFEYNLWKAMEDAIQAWCHPGSPVNLARWPKLPPETGGVALFEGRLKDLVDALGELRAAAVTAGLPRPNQAFWTLSALWSAWLWGRASLGPFRSVLRRRRYDWAWHTTALHTAFNHLAPKLPAGTPMLCLTGEAEPGLLSATLIGAHRAGFRIQGIALRSESGQAQLSWERVEQTPAVSTSLPAEQLVAQAARHYLLRRGEPATYIYLHAAALEALDGTGYFEDETRSPAETLSAMHEHLQQGLSYRTGFIRFGGSQHSLDVGRWWLRETIGAAHPLSDRVEAALAAYLRAQPGASLLEIDSALCQQFPGLLTPQASLLQVCLASYGQQAPGEDAWHLRAQEASPTRERDRQEMRSLLTRLGEQLGFRVEGQSPVLWVEPGGQLGYTFFVITSAMIGQILLAAAVPAETAFIVLPGGRANLVLYKQRRDPRLQKAVEQGWRFLKFRRLRQLADSPLLSRANLDDQFALDPLTYSEPQIPLL